MIGKGTASAVPPGSTKDAGFSLGDRKESIMSMDAKKSMGWTVVLILLGMAALFGGLKWLALLIPAALLVWYTARPGLRAGRN